MDFYVVMERAGFRVSRKKRAIGRIGASHKIRPAETMKWFKDVECLFFPVRSNICTLSHIMQTYNGLIL